MAAKIINDLGYISITDDVIATIAGTAAVESYGVVGMVAKRATDGIMELLGRDNIMRGVRVDTSNDRLVINLYIIVQYGISIAQAGSSLVEAVKFNVQKLTGLEVDSVNVMIQDIRV
ncbi:Asp23/Gls24 family envelope stress response protein [Christensenellaceae bacterium NSJ-44]|jgi:uncharacterized alkaline shock family protein YloU|uniref:Asp23/Gls24 family envelope stress response protein n=1 Tax=Luoshenia tenuis TaxID=2763654 RepID=A0A926CY26_9FIRM|nr:MULTISPECIES: Asp23/Gls24 family envelope stress response protein [Clostridia]MBC8528805.1 Asp23/Gls24 family envelope stress response protein [Luoshenia tenuis]SCJ24093.1 Protein of uncharacterised function (DUF322) [uncultured Clostridium sp.]